MLRLLFARPYAHTLGRKRTLLTVKNIRIEIEETAKQAGYNL